MYRLLGIKLILITLETQRLMRGEAAKGRANEMQICRCFCLIF